MVEYLWIFLSYNTSWLKFQTLYIKEVNYHRLRYDTFQTFENPNKLSGLLIYVVHNIVFNLQV